MFTALYQVAKNTFREALREPIFLLVLLSALCLIGLFPVFSMFVFRAQERLVVDSAMATTMLFGWGIAVLISSYAISREIDNGTARGVLGQVTRHVGSPVGGNIQGKLAGRLSLERQRCC